MVTIGVLGPAGAGVRVTSVTGFAMDSLITAAARALAAGDPLAALKRVALRDDPPALALRGIAMAQLGDLAAREGAAAERCAGLRPARGDGPGALPGRRGRDRARLARPRRAMRRLGAARATLAAHGDRANAAHAGYLDARRLLLIGRLDEAERALGACDLDALPHGLADRLLAGCRRHRDAAHPGGAGARRARAGRRRPPAPPGSRRSSPRRTGRRGRSRRRPRA